jgi:hypothetical protein
MASLPDLYAAHRGKVSDKWDLYIDIYDRVLSPWRDRPIDFVEVGVQNGGSLEIWAKFFPNALSLTGCDVDPRCAALAFDDPRIGVVVGAVNTKEAAKGLLERAPFFDVFIDDGSHVSRDIVMTFRNYFPRVKPGGLFLIEDLHCAYMPGWGGGIDEPASAMGFLKLLVDGLHHQYWKQDADFARLASAYLPPEAKPDIGLASDIASIAFYDSVCVIEKRLAAASARLGRRIVAGDVAAVDDGPLRLRDGRVTA